MINEPRYIETPQELDAAALLETAARIETPEADAAFPAEPLFAVPPQEVVANPAFREVESAAAALLLTKFEAWRYEDEVRILVKLTEDQREGALYFAELNESSIQPSVVIVGPRCSVTRSEIDAAISGYSTPISVVQAKLSTTSFEVIEDASGFSRD